MKIVTVNGVEYYIRQSFADFEACRLCDVHHECHCDDKENTYVLKCSLVQYGYLTRTPKNNMKSDARNDKRDHEKEVKALNRKIEAAQTALRIIGTWASFDNGRALTPEHVLELCETTLRKLK